MHVTGTWPERIPGLRLVAFTGIGAEVFVKFVRHVHEGIGIWGRRLFPRDVGPNRRILGVDLEPLFKFRARCQA